MPVLLCWCRVSSERVLVEQLKVDDIAMSLKRLWSAVRRLYCILKSKVAIGCKTSSVMIYLKKNRIEPHKHHTVLLVSLRLDFFLHNSAENYLAFLLCAMKCLGVGFRKCRNMVALRLPFEVSTILYL